MTHLYPYNPNSKSAKALAQALGIKRLKKDGKPVSSTIINWGASVIPRATRDANIINPPEAVRHACNKLITFRLFELHDVPTVAWTQSKIGAADWYDAGSLVVARQKLTGHSGEGIVLCDPESNDQLVDAPLYTMYSKKKDEYRIHVFSGEVFFVQRKARKLDVPKEQVNWKIRNLAGGFIFANQNVEVPKEAKEAAIMAVRALGLDFGAVDIIHNTRDKWLVLEVNTACGLEGTTLERYAEQLRRVV